MLIRQSEHQSAQNNAGGKRLQSGNGIVLALGEATGHAHAIQGVDAALFAGFNGNRILKLAEDAKLNHEEHSTIDLETGIYEVRLQRTWSMLEDERDRRVMFVRD